MTFSQVYSEPWTPGTTVFQFAKALPSVYDLPARIPGKPGDWVRESERFAGLGSLITELALVLCTFLYWLLIGYVDGRMSW